MKNTYYKKIDYIRVFACIAVLLYHLGLLKGGYLAVCTFFVLSGYLSTVSLWNKKTFSAKEYYLNRLKRLYLPLAVAVFVSIAVISLFPDIRWVNLRTETRSVLLGYNNYWQLNADQDYFTRHVNSPFTHLWYISILMQFDLIWPWIFLLLRKSAKSLSKFLPLLVTGLLAAGSYTLFVLTINSGAVMAAYYGTFCRLFSLLSGAFLGFLHCCYTPPVIRQKNIMDRMFPYWLGVLTVFFILLGDEPGAMMAGMPAAGIITMRLIDYGTTAASHKRPSDQLIRLISGISYEIYLVQYPIIYLLQNTAGLIRIPSVIILTFISAYILHEAVRIPAFSRQNVTKLALSAFIGITAAGGAVRYLSAKDNTEEMKELENKLEENKKIAEEKNQEYLNNSEEEKPAEETQPPAEDNSGEETEAPEETPADTQEQVREMLKTIPVVGIGDSILLDAVPLLYEKFPNGYFDAEISRNLISGTEILESLKAEGKLSNTIILCLSTNGDFRTWLCEDLMETVEEREVFWINAVGADDPAMNPGFQEFAEGYPNLHIVDWESASRDHPEYFYPDGIHVVGDGLDAFADTIYDSVFNFYLEKKTAEASGISA